VPARRGHRPAAREIADEGPLVDRAVDDVPVPPAAPGAVHDDGDVERQERRVHVGRIELVALVEVDEQVIAIARGGLQDPLAQDRRDAGAFRKSRSCFCAGAATSRPVGQMRAGGDMTEGAGSERCRRCGGGTDAGEYVHHFWLREDDGTREVALKLCAACGAGFADTRARDEYVRLVLLG
jgi:hypothetical protein